MITLVSAAVVGAVAWATTRALAPGLAARTPLLQPNHRGIPTPSGAGVGVVAGSVAALGAWSLIAGIAPGDLALRGRVVWPIVLVSLGTALAAAWDDLVGRPRREQGLRALVAGRRIDPQAWTVVAPFVVGLLAAPAGHLPGRVVAACLVTVVAWSVDRVDVAPGRALKLWLGCAAGALVIAASAEPQVAVALAAFVGAAGGFLPFDLRERAALGHLGARSLGAALGMCVALTLGTLAQALLTAGLAVLIARPHLTTPAGRLGPIRRLDQAGRVTSGTTVS